MSPSHIVQYRFMEEEFDTVVSISALNNKHIPLLLDAIFQYLPEGKPIVDTAGIVQRDSISTVKCLSRKSSGAFSISGKCRHQSPQLLTISRKRIPSRISKQDCSPPRIDTKDDHRKNRRHDKEISMAARKSSRSLQTKKCI